VTWPIAVRRRVRRILEDLAQVRIEGMPLGLAREAEEILPKLRERAAPRRSTPIFAVASADKGEGAAEHRRRIRAEVMLRDGTCCAAGFLGQRCCGPPELDHFFGRGKAPETVQTTWILCQRHHRMKTDNVPHRAAWLRLFREHAVLHAYHYAVRLAGRGLALERAQHPEAVE
jgi:5-methylcytosine-specific restriction endonuclease McrA